MGIQTCGREMEIFRFPQCNEDIRNARCRVLHKWCLSQQHFANCHYGKYDTANNFGAVQLMLDDYLDLIV